jgi:hypothetical protein
MGTGLVVSDCGARIPTEVLTSSAGTTGSEAGARVSFCSGGVGPSPMEIDRWMPSGRPLCSSLWRIPGPTDSAIGVGSLRFFLFARRSGAASLLQREGRGESRRVNFPVGSRTKEAPGISSCGVTGSSIQVPTVISDPSLEGSLPFSTSVSWTAFPAPHRGQTPSVSRMAPTLSPA